MTDIELAGIATSATDEADDEHVTVLVRIVPLVAFWGAFLWWVLR